MRFVFERLKPRAWRGEPWQWAQPKHNGWHVTLFKNQLGHTSIYGKSLRVTEEYLKYCPTLAELPNINEFVRNAPPLSAVDGELCPTDGSHPSQVPTLLKEKPRALSYVTFAVPYWKGGNLKYSDVDAALRIAENAGVKCSVRMLHQFMPQDRDALLLQAASCHLEGWVLKQFNYSGWFKLKIEKTVDCVVTSIKPGKGKYRGMVGSLGVSLLHPTKGLVQVGWAGGMADIEREAMGEHCVGRVVEVEYQAKTPHGRLQHARFNRWRPDKDDVECTWEQLDA